MNSLSSACCAVSDLCSTGRVPYFGTQIMNQNEKRGETKVNKLRSFFAVWTLAPSLFLWRLPFESPLIAGSAVDFEGGRASFSGRDNYCVEERAPGTKKRGGEGVNMGIGIEADAKVRGSLNFIIQLQHCLQRSEKRHEIWLLSKSAH